MWGILDQLERTCRKREKKRRSRRKSTKGIVKYCCIDCVITFYRMNRVHIYSLNSLAGYGTQNLLEKKHLNKLILRYTDPNSLSVESLLIALADPSMPSPIFVHAWCAIGYNIPTLNRHAYLPYFHYFSLARGPIPATKPHASLHCTKYQLPCHILF